MSNPWLQPNLAPQVPNRFSAFQFALLRCERLTDAFGQAKQDKKDVRGFGDFQEEQGSCSGNLGT